jgi:alginate O-acetyltransferase complex protein AlgJ
MPDHGTLSREEIAKIEIGHTDSTPAKNWFLTLFFLVVIFSVPVLQNAREFAAIRSGAETGRRLPQSWDVFSFLLPSLAEWRAFFGAGDAAGMFASARQTNNRMLRDIQAYETALKDRDGIVEAMIPVMQTVVSGWLKGGNEDASCGRDGWLFYRRDLESLTGPGFLEPAVLRQRGAGGSELVTPPQPDPVKAIVDFRDQLAKRGIALLVFPAPVKPSICPEDCTSRYAGTSAVIENPSAGRFRELLAAAGIPVFDPAAALVAAKAEGPVYLRTDTHWTPQGMELAARGLAAAARDAAPLSAAATDRFKTLDATAESLGDVATMLDLPAGQTFFPRESVALRQVLSQDRFWRPDPRAEVLFLGDSFANIYSLAAMGWGESAGLVEHLSLALGLPVDAICRNDAGSHATREMLARELRSGRDRLAGKKLVIWEFAARELACGDWKLLSMELGEKRETGFYVAPADRPVRVSGVVQAVSNAPRPGSVPYKDHILTIHLADLESEDDAAAKGKEAVVHAWSMQDQRAMPAARYRPGETVRLELVPWDKVAAEYAKLQSSDLDDEALEDADRNWAAAEW